MKTKQDKAKAIVIKAKMNRNAIQTLTEATKFLEDLTNHCKYVINGAKKRTIGSTDARALSNTLATYGMTAKNLGMRETRLAIQDASKAVEKRRQDEGGFHGVSPFENGEDFLRKREQILIPAYVAIVRAARKDYENLRRNLTE